MKIDVIMPKMGESLQEGTIVKWLKKVGDKIERDEMILEISTDKVDTEVPAPVAGVLIEILAQENQTVEVGSIIAAIETEASSITSPSTFQQSTQPVETIEIVTTSETDNSNDLSGKLTGTDIIDIVMPKMGESLQEGTIVKWLKKVGDRIERDEMILEISTDKVDTEVPAPVAGTLFEILAQEQQTVEVGKVIAKISTGSGINAPKTENHKASSGQVENWKSMNGFPKIEISRTDEFISDEKHFYSPVVREIARERGIIEAELERIKGSGIDGRVSKADIMNYIETKATATKPAGHTILPSVTQSQVVHSEPKQISNIPTSRGVGDEVIPMDRMRQIIAEHMTMSKQTSAHVTSVAEADVTGIVRFREKFKLEFEHREGFKLTYTPFFVKAAVEGVKAFPMVNVSVDGKSIIRHLNINLGFATALDDGNLIVPVIKNADALNLAGLARSVFDLSSRARSKKLNPDDIQGGTFTVTNVGTFGTLFGTPVINQPQCAIMGIGAIEKRPVVRQLEGEDVIVIREMAYVSLTYDHRVIDGMLAGRCLAQIVKSLESMNETNLAM